MNNILYTGCAKIKKINFGAKKLIRKLFIIHILYTGCAKIKKINFGAKRLTKARLVG